MGRNLDVIPLEGLDIQGWVSDQLSAESAQGHPRNQIEIINWEPSGEFQDIDEDPGNTTMS